jgi:hypothetical protein
MVQRGLGCRSARNGLVQHRLRDGSAKRRARQNAHADGPASRALRPLPARLAHPRERPRRLSLLYRPAPTLRISLGPPPCCVQPSPSTGPLACMGRRAASSLAPHALWPSRATLLGIGHRHPRPRESLCSGDTQTSPSTVRGSTRALHATRCPSAGHLQNGRRKGLWRPLVRAVFASTTLIIVQTRVAGRATRWLVFWASVLPYLHLCTYVEATNAAL